MRVPPVSRIVTLLLFLLVAASACTKKPDPSKVSTVTTFDKPELRLELPGEWHAVPTEHGYELRNGDGSRQVIASVLSTDATALPDRRANLEKLVAIRREVMGSLSDGGAAVSEPVYETHDDRQLVRFHGVDSSHDAFASFLLVATSTAVVTVAYYEYKNANARDAEARAQTVFASVVAK